MKAAWLRAARATIDGARSEARGRSLHVFSPDADVNDALDAFAREVAGASTAIVAQRTLAMVRLLERARPEWTDRECEAAVTCTLRVYARRRLSVRVAG